MLLEALNFGVEDLRNNTRTPAGTCLGTCGPSSEGRGVWDPSKLRIHDIENEVEMWARGIWVSSAKEIVISLVIISTYFGSQGLGNRHASFRKLDRSNLSLIKVQEPLP